MNLKTWIRHVLVRMGLTPLVTFYWKLTGRNTAIIEGDRRTRFAKIYEDGHWTHNDMSAESLSGYGSTLNATSTLRKDLANILDELNTQLLLDIGRGDFNWMKTIELNCNYVGIDIVPSIISVNTAKYASDRRSFFSLDAVAEPIPQADTVLCREVLFHLSLKDAQGLLANVRNSGARYLLATSDPSVRFNVDIPSGEWRDINLALRPYGLGAPDRHISDGDGPNPNRILGIWDLSRVFGRRSEPSRADAE